MGVDAMKIRVQVRKFLVISIKRCYNSVCHHPFLVGMACFLIFMYRSFPFLFSLLVSASPVLVCTAVLLGTLLSFGEPSIPEIEKETERDEEEVAHEISSLRARVVEDATVVVERDESFSLERFIGKRSEDEAIANKSLVDKKYCKIEKGDGFSDYIPLNDENYREIQFEKQVIEEVEREHNDSTLEKEEIHREKPEIEEMLRHGHDDENQFSLIQNMVKENLEVEERKLPGEFVEAQMDEMDPLNFSQGSSWKRANDENEEDEDEEGSDSGSDRAESSSPDASMADIIPMLDELHPLLDEDVPQPAHMSHDGSGAGSERSHKNKESSVDSEEENQVDEEEDGDDDNDNEEEEAQEGKEDESKSAIKWTEDDQKNLMDLGTLEIERNQRLESLIARRRARRTMRFVAEKNLIDLDGADLPFNIPPISITRRNPFDLPYDDVPGSAPSILLARKNPFDLPYDSGEEKPDLKGDSFQQEFSAFQQREPFFCRHESFRPSVLGGPKQERQDVRWKPYFVPERFTNEGTSYPMFQRQLSEASESKVSSVPDTESVSSAVEEEDKKLNEDVSQENEMMSLDHTSVLVERGSLSSEDSVDIEQGEKRDLHHSEVEISFGDGENHYEIDLNLSASEGAIRGELNTNEILLRMEGGEGEYSSRSSLSSLSEVDEKISNVKKGSTSQEPRSSQIEECHPDFHFMTALADDNQLRESVLEPRDDHVGDSSISKQSSLESDLPSLCGVLDNNHHDETTLDPKATHIGDSGISMQTSLNSNFHLTRGLVDENQRKEAVYDSSPPSIDKFLSFSSVSSDAQGEISEMGSPPELAKFADIEPEVHSESMEKDTSSYKEMQEGSLPGDLPDENTSRSREVTEFSEDDSTEVGLSEVCPFDTQNGLMKPKPVVEHVAADLPLSSSKNGSAKEVVAYEAESSHHRQDQLDLLTLDAQIVVQTHSNVIKKLDYASSSYQMVSEETSSPPTMYEHVLANPRLSSAEANSEEDHAMGIEEIIPLEQDQVHVNGCQPVVEELVSMASSSEHVSTNNLHLYAHGENEPVVVVEETLGDHLDISSSDTRHEEEHSRRKEEALQFEQVQACSSSSDSTIVAGLHQDVDVKVVSMGSSYQHLTFEEKSMHESEKQLPWSDKSVVEPSFNNNDEPQELSITLAYSTEEISTSNNVKVLEVYDPEDIMSRNINSLSSDSISVPSESLTYQSQGGGGRVDLKDDIRDKILYEDSGRVLEHSNFSTEAYGSPVAEVNINEEEDEIKEIDEGLLSELDAVGDFSVKEVVGESLHDELMPERTNVGRAEFNLLPNDSGPMELKPELPVLEVRSVEDIDLAFNQLIEGVDVEEVILPSILEDQLVADESEGRETSSCLQVEARSLEDIHNALKQISEEAIEKLSDSKDGPVEVNKVGSTEELPVLEVRSVEDFDLAFKQPNGGVDFEEVILPSMIEDHVVVDESKGPGETSSGLQVVEARSSEDIHTAAKQISERTIEELSDSKDRPAEVNVGPIKELPVLEVRSLEDIDLAFKQFHEGVDVEEVILPSMIGDQVVVDESEGPGETSSGLQVVEARSLEDIHTAIKQILKGTTDELSKLSDSKDGPAEVNEVGSTKELPVLEVKSIKDIELAFKQLHEGVDVEEVILPSMIDDQLVVAESKSPGETSSGLQVVEARSLEDIHTVVKQFAGSNIEKLPKPSDAEDKAAKRNEEGSTKEIESRTSEPSVTGSTKGIETSTVEVIEVGSMEERGSSTGEFAVQGNSTIAPLEPNNEFDKTSENSSLSILDAKGKKAKSMRSNSSSNSSSSSSSSSSDSD